MRHPLRAVLVLVLLTALASDARGDSLPWTHTRALSPAARDLLDIAVQRSALVRALIDDLERTDVIVLLTFSHEPGTENRRPFMRFVSAARGARYVAINLYWKPRPPVMDIPILAHELQHALEFAASADARDQDGFSRLFARIGWPAGPHRFETRAARDTEERVRQELIGNSTQGDRAYSTRR